MVVTEEDRICMRAESVVMPDKTEVLARIKILLWAVVAVVVLLLMRLWGLSLKCKLWVRLCLFTRLAEKLFVFQM